MILKLNLQKEKKNELCQINSVMSIKAMITHIINANVKVEALTQYGNSLFNIFIHIWGTVSGHSRTFSLAVVWR